MTETLITGMNSSDRDTNNRNTKNGETCNKILQYACMCKKSISQPNVYSYYIR